MSFQNPVMLWLLLALLVAALLYLLPMPRRRVKASALYLWERFLDAERFGHRSERFRRALGFALLAAILAALILAAADPLLGRSSLATGRAIVLLDSSASMNAVVDGVSNLERAKRAMSDLVGSAPSSASIAIVEYPGELHVVAPFGPGGPEAARTVSAIQPFDGPGDLGRALEQAWGLWGGDEQTQVYVFTDAAVPNHGWGQRLHAWIAPPAADNAAVTELSAQRKGAQVSVQYTLANFGASARQVQATVSVNGSPRDVVQATLEAGRSVSHTSLLDESAEARVEVKLDGSDALASDDSARALVPAQGDARVAVVWPEAHRRNEYVTAVLSAVQQEGGIGTVGAATATTNPASAPAGDEGGGAAVSVFVNHVPAVWPGGGAIVLHPLRGGAVEVTGLHTDSLTISRQANHPLLEGVDFRGLTLKGAVQAPLPSWAEPLVWADELPVIWTGEIDKTKVLFVGIPVLPTGSRFPLVASFPVLMRNALDWMLPAADVRRPGERVDGWSSRAAGFVQNPADGATHAFSVLSGRESDLRRGSALSGESFARRQSWAMPLFIFALALLPAEWWLFHRRVTE